VSHANTFTSLTPTAIACNTSSVGKQDFEKSFYLVFGAMLARARKRRNVSQEALAKELGLTRTSVTNIEKGRQPLQLHSLYLLAQSLKVEVKDLLPSPAALEVSQPSANISVSNTEWLTSMDVRLPQGALSNAKDRRKSKASTRE
jgi:transcriptional regulator with XRE-family HTH domain